MNYKKNKFVNWMFAVDLIYYAARVKRDVSAAYIYMYIA